MTNHFQRYDQIGLATDWRSDAERYADEMATRFLFEKGGPQPSTRSRQTKAVVIGVLRSRGGPVVSAEIIAEASSAGHNRDAVARAMDRLCSAGAVKRVGMTKHGGRHCVVWQLADDVSER